MSHVFGASGSFIASTALATSEEARIGIEIDGALHPAEATALANEALATSPAIALLRLPMRDNSFALSVNGHRRTVIEHQDSLAGDARDPFLVYPHPPRPLDQGGRTDLLKKTGEVEAGEAAQVPLTATGKRLITIAGSGQSRGGEFVTDTWIARNGMSHFRLVSDDGAGDAAPSGLALLSAGIAFCYMTQLARYIDAQKLPIHGVRLVQHSPYAAGPGAMAGPIDTHLFLNGEAPVALHRKLLRIAADTCFMHAAAMGSVAPVVGLRLNGMPVS